MSVQTEIDDFLTALYKDSRLKNRIILWTFVVLVFPAALLLSLGVPAKATYAAMLLLLLPLQWVVYHFRKIPEVARVAKVAMAPAVAKAPVAKAPAVAVPDANDFWIIVLQGRSDRVVVGEKVSWQEFLQGRKQAPRESLQGDLPEQEQSVESLDPQVQAMLGKHAPQPSFCLR